MSSRLRVDPPLERSPELQAVLAEITERAPELDSAPRFPSAALAELARVGALAVTVPSSDRVEPSALEIWCLVRAIAAADGSVGRIVDGHLNAVERLAVAAPADVARRELTAVAAGERLLGVWGADPAPEEGEPARVRLDGGEHRLEGVKTFCSGAGGVDAALVLARGPEAGPPLLCLVEIDESVVVDREWFAGSGLRASESHRVRFESTPVAALLGGPGELAREPFFSRDAMRTAASWAGMADAAAEDALADLAARRRGDELAHLAAGRIGAALTSIDALLGHCGAAVAEGRPLRTLSVQMRREIVRAADLILAEAAAACGSRPFARGSRLDRARRDLQLFTLQHRLDPLLAREGARSLDPERSDDG